MKNITILILTMLILIVSCSKNEPLSADSESIANLFLQSIDENQFAKAYLLTAPEFRQNVSYIQFQNLMRQKQSAHGEIIKRKGVTSSFTTMSIFHGKSTRFTGNFKIFGSYNNIEEEIQVIPDGVIYYGFKNLTQEISGNDFFAECNNSSCKVLNKTLDSILKKAKIDETAFHGLYIHYFSPSTGNNPIANQFISALQSGNKKEAQSLVNYEIPDNIYNIKLSNLKPKSNIEIHDLEIKNYINNIYLYSGSGVYNNKSFPFSMLIGFNNKKAGKIESIDIATIPFDTENSYLILDKSVYLNNAKSL